MYTEKMGFFLCDLTSFEGNYETSWHDRRMLHN